MNRTNDPWRNIDRRELLRRTALLVPALHGGLLTRPVKAASATETTPRVRFRELHLRTHRPEELRTFYADVLQLPIAEEGDDLVVRAGSSRLRFSPIGGGSEPFYHFAFSISENKLSRAIEWMKPRCPLLQREGNPVVHFRSINAHSIYFYDPSGSILEFIAHHDRDNSSSGAFSPRDIEHASEIGLVVPRVSEVVGQLGRRLGLGIYGPNSWETFAPVGDIHGFFVVVQTERIWLMTDDPAAVFPTGVTLGRPETGELTIGNLPYRIELDGDGAA